jgi:hypothetical protein
MTIWVIIGVTFALLVSVGFVEQVRERVNHRR